MQSRDGVHYLIHKQQHQQRCYHLRVKTRLLCQPTRRYRPCTLFAMRNLRRAHLSKRSCWASLAGRTSVLTKSGTTPHSGISIAVTACEQKGNLSSVGQKKHDVLGLKRQAIWLSRFRNHECTVSLRQLVAMSCGQWKLRLRIRICSYFHMHAQ